MNKSPLKFKMLKIFESAKGKRGRPLSIETLKRRHDNYMGKVRGGLEKGALTLKDQQDILLLTQQDKKITENAELIREQEISDHDSDTESHR